MKLPKGYNKKNTLKYMKQVRERRVPIAQYCRDEKLKPTPLVDAFVQYCPALFNDYYKWRVKNPAFLKCPYCERPFFPGPNQQYCSQKCARDARANRNYFGGKRQDALGMREGICQVCARHPGKGLSPHHVIGKENDPENKWMLALCAGCHDLVTKLGKRTFIRSSQAWEMLISLALLRKYGKPIETLGISVKLVDKESIMGV